MGGQESKEGVEKLNVFSPEEKQNIHQIYLKILKGQKTISNDNFKEMSGINVWNVRNKRLNFGSDPSNEITTASELLVEKYLPPWLDPYLRDRLYKAALFCEANKSSNHGNKADTGISEGQFGGFLAEVLKGMYSEQADILCLLSDSTDAQFQHSKLLQSVFSVIKSYVAVSKSDVPCQTWQCIAADSDMTRLSTSLMEDLKQQESVSQHDVEQWLSKCPLFLLMFNRVFKDVFNIDPGQNHPPKCLLPVVSDIDWNKFSTILDTASILYLNHHLPSMHQAEWRFLYSNRLYGDSFSQLVTHVTSKGPNVLIVRDKEGHVFGAFVDESWDLRPQFYGLPTCFVFTLSPRFGVYTATGYNTNYMYLNQGQQTLPNGLGVGGQLDYFGLWIDHSFNKGHSKAVPKCTTYGSPQLSSQPEFEVDTVEVWAVGPDQKKDKEEEDAENEYKKKSILDKDLGAKAILEMAGKKQLSEGLRELTEDEEMSDEMKRKMNVIPKMF